MVVVAPLSAEYIEDAVGLQRACFPEPFPEDLLWSADHLRAHLAKFPEGQFVALSDGRVVGSASNTIIAESVYQAHGSWTDTVGGPFLETFDAEGTTLYGLDISVHPEFRRRGVGRHLYEARFELVRHSPGLQRYATACRLPGFWTWGGDLDDYLATVRRGELDDRTLTPLLRMGLTLVEGLYDYMEDAESLNCAALLEWTP